MEFSFVGSQELVSEYFWYLDNERIHFNTYLSGKFLIVITFQRLANAGMDFSLGLNVHVQRRKN